MRTYIFYVVMGIMVFIGVMMFLGMLSKSSFISAIDELGCESVLFLGDRFLGERVCKVDGAYHFIDVSCNRWGWNCTAQLVKVEGFVVQVKK